MLKNRIIFTLLLMLMCLPTLGIIHEESEDAIADTTTIQQENEFVQPETPSIYDETPHKQPISKRKIIKKFLFAMLGVGASSLTIYFVLSLYNGIRNNSINTGSIQNEEEPSLDMPDNITNAIKTFLDKTKWNI